MPSIACTACYSTTIIYIRALVYQGRQEFQDYNTADVISSNISGAIYIVHFDKRGRICSDYYTLYTYIKLVWWLGRG